MNTAKIIICDWNEPYLIEDISKECLEAYQMARDKSAPFEERVQHIKALIELVHAGDVNAEYCLGLLTRDDFTDAQNAQKSELWFSSAAAQGHAYAMYHYAECLEKRGASEEAKAWYEKAAAAGVPYTRCRLAALGIREAAPGEAECIFSAHRTIEFYLNRSCYKAYVAYDKLGKSHYYVPGLLGGEFHFKRGEQKRYAYICTEVLIQLIQNAQKGRIA